MRAKFLITFFLFIIFSTNSFAKPRCDLFYEAVYNQTNFPFDIDLLLHGDVKHIGIRLLAKPYEEGAEADFVKNEDGYYIVGKVHKNSIITLNPYDLDKVMVGDIILEINDQDIRKTYDASEFGIYISDAYEEDALIKLKLLRILPNNQKKIIEIETQNEITTYNEPYIDIFVKGMSLNEKEGTYDISIETEFTELLPRDYNITKAAHKYLVHKVNSNEYPSEEEIETEYYSFEECPFSEHRWSNANSSNPAYGIQFNNVISEDKNKRSSTYLVIPYFDTDEDVENSPYVEVIYKLYTTYKVKNYFNLKSFPFDRQSIVFEITNSRFNIDEWKAIASEWTKMAGKKFKEENAIAGWNITDFKVNYTPFQERFTDDKYTDGFKMVFEVERKSRYYIFKIIFPIILILIVCWSAIWIDPKEIESRLTITIVCLLSLIAYNFVIDSEMPKLEYLTIMDYVILVSYVYATIPNFLSVITFHLIKNNKALAGKYEIYGKRYGLLSYLLLVFFIIIINTLSSPENTNAMLSWLAPR